MFCSSSWELDLSLQTFCREPTNDCNPPCNHTRGVGSLKPTPAHSTVKPLFDDGVNMDILSAVNINLKLMRISFQKIEKCAHCDIINYMSLLAVSGIRFTLQIAVNRFFFLFLV